VTDASRSTLTSTYRLQFSKNFTFSQAEQLVPYLAELGISHLYASPYLKARAGSSHGYDITDYNALNPEIGDEAALDAMVAALRRHDMGQVLDFVPNHMGVGKADNEWWLDVLEWGMASPYAEYFDIEWTPAKEDLRGKVLLPFLGDHYGIVLEKGELQLVFDAEHGSFCVSYHEHAFPIRPAHYAEIVAPYLARRQAAGDFRGETIALLSDMAARSLTLRISRLPADRRRAVREKGIVFKRDLAALVAANSQVRDILDEAVREVNGTPGVATSFVPLHRLLERQAYRLAYWRVAANEINYRRFFDVSDLAGVRMENAGLFDVSHRLVLRLAAEGKLDGLRIDHVDGMLDPAQYCHRLAARAGEIDITLRVVDPNQAGSLDPTRRFYIVVEKILARHETLRREWPIDGTTGYDVLNLINGLFVRPEAEAPLAQIYGRFIEQDLAFDDVLYQCKKHVMERVLAGELEVLANALDQISESHWRTRDFTLIGLRTALEEVAAWFPVYRTYVDDKSVTADDRRDIDWAVSQARKHSEDKEDTVFDFIHAVLTTDLVRKRRSGYSRRAVIRCAMKFQQYTGPVMAKSLEDTSFYRFNRLLSLNEVGGDPRRFGLSPSAFHHLIQDRARNWPRAMTATATHDTKRGEDTRARLNVLSEMSEEWEVRIGRWSTFNRRFKTLQDEACFPTANDEYLLYQLILGAWPNELADKDHLDAETLESFRKRVEGSAIKSVREAKQHTSWTRPDQAYEDAVLNFIRGLLDPARSPQFLADLIEFAGRVAWFGMMNSLSQTVLKLTMPGIPDTYQGAELWDYAMVDPDNRRPVDFARRVEFLRDLRERYGEGGALSSQAFAPLFAEWPDGRIKLLITSRLLRLRRDMPELFVKGGYQPLTVEGARGDHLCAFARPCGKQLLIVAVPRFFVSLTDGRQEVPTAGAWADTVVAVPPELGGRRLTNMLTGETATTGEKNGAPALAADALLQTLPFGVWLAEGEPPAG
jgi:(1->4)-alpha-D-glucan 1-alpha-D-glucosylmutase